MRAAVQAICIFLFLINPSVTQADEAADKLLADSAARTKSLRTLTARIDLSWHTATQSLKKNVGTVTLMKPNYALIRLSGDYPLVTLASDGRSRYLFSEPAKYTLANADLGGKNIDTPWWALPVRFFFTQNVKPFGPDSPLWIKSRLAGVETIDRETYNVLELVGEQPMAYVARLYFDNRKILRRSTVTFGEGSNAAVFSAQINNVRIGQRLRPSAFQFRPPTTARLDTGAESKMLALGDVAPEFSLLTPAGETLTLANLRLGKKATLINFWYLACPPCREEFRLFQKLYADLKDDGFTIVGINKIDGAAEVRSYVKESGITFPMVLGEREAPGVVANYRVESYPSTYLLNGEGKIVYRSIGLDEAGLRRALGALGFDKQQNREQIKTYEFRNGKWFDGRGFRDKTFYSVAGRLTTARPSRIDEKIDLSGGFVVPPFGDAHCHHFDSSYNIDEQIGMYLRDGVFYAAVQTDTRSGAVQVANKVNQPSSVDVSYSHGALTSSYGHGVEIYEGLALFQRPGAINPEEVGKLRQSRLRENDSYYIIDTADDLARKWPMVLAGRPDFIKIYLLTSERYEETRKRTDTIGDRGVDPKLVPIIVKRAHADSLRVSAHVDTVSDYRTALRGGVDAMAHLPGYYVDAKDDPRKYMLTDSDARETARRGVWVAIAPVAYDMFNPEKSSYDAELTRRTDAVRVHNLKLLLKHRARLAFGSDRYGSTPVDDVLYLKKLGVFSNLELLKTWCEATPEMIFPGRKIGHLRNGYEASFLVLTGNPLEDFTKVKSIRLRFKQGIPIPTTAGKL